MRPETITMEVPTSAAGAAALGKAEVTDRFTEKAVQISGYVDGTWQLQGTIDLSEWYQIGADITGDGYVSITGFHNRLRLKCTAAPAAAGPDVTLGMLDTRTE